MTEIVEAGVRFVAQDEGVSATTEKMGTHFTRTTEKMRQTIKQTGYLRLALTRIATYTAIFTFFGSLTKLIGEAISLQTRLAEVSTLVDMRNADMAESFQTVVGDLLALNAHMGDSISLTKGLYEIMSAGVSDPVDAFKLLVVSAKYAKAGITDLATAASSLTAIMKAYGYTADEMRAKSDMLFASVMEGKYHAEELNQAIGKVLPTAAAMGVQIDEVSAALAVLTQRGLDVSEAATGLNRMMLSFLRPIDKTKKVFEKLGWEWGRNAFIGIGLVGVLRRLMEASKRYGDILPTIFRRQRALRVGFVLAGEGFKDYVKLLQKIRDATADGGEVARGYGKMIGTVSEEVKAAGQRMLAVMYDLWKGKGFEWLGGFIRLLSSFIAVLLKSSRVTVAAIPIIWGLAKAIKTAQVSAVLARSNMTTFYATTGKMTKALYAQGQAYQLATARAEKFARVLRLLKGGVVAGVIAYVAIKTALDIWIAKSDRGITAIHRQTTAMKNLKDEMELYSVSAQKAGELTGKAIHEIERLAALRIEEQMKWLGTYYKIVGQFAMRIHELGIEMDENLSYALKIVAKGWTEGKDTVEGYDQALRIVARALGVTEQETEKWIDAQRTNIEVMREHIEGMRFLHRLQRDWNKIVESSSKHVYNLAQELSQQELQDGIKLMEELMELAPETPKWERAKRYFESLGLALEDLTKEKIPEFLAKWREAAEKQPEVFRQLQYEEWMREYLAIFEKMHPPLQALETSVEALADTWKTKWVEAYGDSTTVMKLFVEEHRAQLELIKNNLERIGDVQGKVLVENMLMYLNKGLTAQQKYSKKAVALHESVVNDFIRLDSNMEILRNELRGKEWDDVAEQAKKFIKLEQRKLDKLLEMNLKAGGNLLMIWAEYIQKRKKLEESLTLALQVANLRRIEDLAKALKKEIDMTSWSEYEKQVRYEQTYRQYFELMRELGITTKAELKAGLAVWKQTFGAMNTFTRSIFRKIIRDFGKFFSSVFTDLKDLNKNFGSFIKGTLQAWGMMIAQMLLAWFKGLVKMKAAFQTFLKTLKASMAIFADAFAIWVAAGMVKHLLGVFGIINTLDEEVQAVIDKTEEAKRKGEEVASVIRKIQLVAPSVTAPSTGGDKEVTRWIDDYAVALEEVVKWLTVMESKTEFTRQYLELFNEAWDELISAMEEAGLEGSEAILDLIRRTRELGIEVKVLDEYMLKWLDKGAEGLNAMAWAAGTTEEELKRLANLALTTFNSMLASGRTWGEALAAMEETLLILKLRMEALGVEGGAAIDSLLDIALVRRLYSDLFEAIEGNLVVLNALGNTFSFFGEEGAQAFADVAAQAKSYYDRLIDAGLTSEQALAVMAPTLERLQFYAEEYGLELDANTLALIDQANALGLLEGAGQSVVEVLSEGFASVVTAIQDLINILIGTGGLGDALDNVGGRFDWGERGIRGASPGMGISPGGYSPLGIPESGELVAVIEIDGQRFYKAVVPYFRKGVRFGEFDEGDY